MEFQNRHIGPDEVDLDKMLTTIDADPSAFLRVVTSRLRLVVTECASG